MTRGFNFLNFSLKIKIVTRLLLWEGALNRRMIGGNDWLNESLRKSEKFLKRYLTTYVYFFTGDVRTLTKNSKSLSAPVFFAANTVLSIALIRIMWPENPVSTYQLPPVFDFLKPIVDLLPVPFAPYAFLYIAIINMPMIVVTLILGYNLRISRVYSSSLYSFSISILFFSLILIVETAGLHFLHFLSLEFESGLLIAIGIGASGFLLLLLIRSFKFLGIAHGISGYRFFIINALVVGLPVLAIDIFSSPESKLRWIPKVLDPRPLQRFHIPSGSMRPTLPVGTRLLANKWLPFEQISRGDIVVFKHPVQGNAWITRVVALPGDTIQMINGELYLNGKVVPRQKLKPLSNPYGEKPVDHYRQTFPNGKMFNIMELAGDDGISDNTDKFLIPKGHFFGMGDNRDNSNDSRYPNVGYIPISNYIGKAYFATYPRRVGKI